MIKRASLHRIVLAVLGLGIGAMAGVGVLSFGAERLQEHLALDRMTRDAGKLPSAQVGMVLGTAPKIGLLRRINDDFVARLDAAAALWRAGKVKYLLVSGNGLQHGFLDETTAMRAGLIGRGVPPDAIYRDDWGLRTWDSVVRARDVFGQKKLIIVSQRSHVARALFLADSLGLDAFGLEAEDRLAQGFMSRIRPYPAAVLAFFDAWRGKLPRLRGTPVVIGVDPTN